MMSDAERSARQALSLALLLYGFWIMRTPDGYHFLDSVDLPIHETGHLVFAWGSEVITALGGTLFQLILPALFGVYFAVRRDWHAATVPLWWIGQNGWNIARYVADARAQELPLVGGGEHDWAFLLSEWDLLGQDQVIAGRIRVAGLVLMVGAAVAGWWLIRREPRTTP